MALSSLEFDKSDMAIAIIMSVTIHSKLRITRLAVVKDGMCPAVSEGSAGICVNECENDANCAGSSKCCSNGCGKVCLTPEPSELFDYPLFA